MNILDKRATNPAAALDGTELVYVAQLGADAVTTVQDIQYFAKTKLGAASSTADGYLTSTDWTTFNGKQEPLADVITANTYGSSTQYPIVTVNAKGIVTGVTLQTVAPTFSDSAFRVQDNGDATKQIAFEASAIGTGTTRTITMPNANVDLGNIGRASPYLLPTSSFTAVANRRYSLINAIGAVDITMPTTPSDGDTVEVYLAAIPAYNTVRFAKSDKDLLFAGSGTPYVQPTAGNLVATYIWTYSLSSNCWLQTIKALESDFTAGAFAIRDTTTWNKALKFNVAGLTAGATRTITAADKNINLGDLSAIATTNSNVLSGTRNRILGGSSNTVSGTDNVVVTGASNTLSGVGQVAITGNFTTDVTWNGAVIVASQAASASYLQTISTTTALSGNTFWGSYINTACTTGGAYSAATVPKSYLSLYATTGGTQTFSSMAVHTLTILGRTANSGGSTVNSGYRFAGKRMVVVNNTGGTVTVTTTTLGTDYNPAGAVTMNISDDAGKLKIAPFFTSENPDMTSSTWNVLVESVYTTL